jgi:Mrp family chromosome partitioning ATPase/LPS O-antigen subunit length determinant protein (WzzB/FepE family)
MSSSRTTAEPEWLQPPTEQEGLGRYVEVIRERAMLIVAATLAAIALAVAYLATAEDVYEASADLLITPASEVDTVLISLGALRESTDPTRDVETAARLVTTQNVARRAIEELGLDTDPTDLLEKVSAEPVAQSNIVAISAEAPSADQAAALANAIARGTVAERTAKLHATIRERLPILRERLEASPGDELLGPDSISAQVARMETLLAGDDPTVRLETAATAPQSPSSPKPALTLIAALLAGLVIGIGGAFALHAIDPILRREEQLRKSYRLPILGRVPRDSRRSARSPLPPSRLSPATLESYRTLRTTITARGGNGGGGGRVLLVTGASPSEGKTTSAINLASALAVAGHSVILIEADLRRPAIGEALGIAADRGVVSVLLESTALEEALVPSPTAGLDLRFLLADYEGGWIADLFSLPAARTMIDEARRLAEFVVVDSPPLTAVVDALPLAEMADDVAIVTRLNHTRLDRLRELGELLAANEIEPLGFAVLGVPVNKTGGVYYGRGTSNGDGARRLTARRPAVR